MSDKVKKELKKFIQNSLEMGFELAIVTSVDADKGVCNAKLMYDEDIELEELQLKVGNITESSYFLLIPVLASTILIETETNTVLMVSQIDEVRIKVDNVEYSINKDGILIKKGNDTLKSLLGELIDEVKKITVVVDGSTSTTPSNAALFDTIKTKINNLLR